MMYIGACNRTYRIGWYVILFQYIATVCNICQSPLPDHKAICMSLILNENKRGRGYRKLNNSILKHTEFEDGIKCMYEQLCRGYENYVLKGVLWEYFKMRVKQYSMAFSIHQAKTFYYESRKLESDKIDTQLAATPCEVLSAERRIIKAKLEDSVKSSQNVTRYDHVSNRWKRVNNPQNISWALKNAGRIVIVFLFNEW